MLISSCRSTKFIDQNQALVREANIVFKDDDINDQANLRYQLEGLISQPPPDKFLFIPRDYFFLKNQDPGDTLPRQNFARKFLADEAIIFDSLLVKETAEKMQSFLRNKKGYFNATVTSNYSVKNQIAKTKFTVLANDQYQVDSVFFRTNDTEISQILNEIEGESLINKNSPIDATLFEREKQRIFQALQDRGYANFLVNNIVLKGDSSNQDKKIDVLFDIAQAEGSEALKKYEVGTINIFTDYDQDRSYPVIPSRVINGKNYYTMKNKFIVKPRAIDKQIFLKTGKVYSRSDHYQTIQKLSALSTYKFVKVTPSRDITSDSIINYDIYLTPHKHRWISDLGTGLFYSTLGRVGQQLVGVSLDGSLVNRNTLGGSEKNELLGEVGLEYSISNLAFNAINVGISDVLSYPTQVDYLGLIGLIYSITNTSTALRQKYEVGTSTSFSAGFTYQDIFNLYKNNTFNAKATYQYDTGKNWRISFSPTGFNLLNFEVRPGFADIINRSPFLERSFKSVVFTGLLFKDIAGIYTSPESPRGFSWSLITNLELSGGEVFLANKLYNSIAKDDINFQLSDKLDFANFMKVEAEVRLHQRINPSSSIAGRANVGYASAYSGDPAVPYIKQFFVGGPNSIRAWQSRELGPGSFSRLLITPDTTQQFYQTGDFKTEFNIEYRADLFWIFEYALFVDAGNVWTLDRDIGRPGAELTNFFNQMAIGWGWGLRLDFSYFNLRFDFGYKLKKTFQTNVGGGELTYFVSPIGQGIGNANIAINYPF